MDATPVVIVAPAPEPEPPIDAPPARPRVGVGRPLYDGGGELSIAFGRATVGVGDTPLRGSGTSTASGARQSFDATGRDAGFLHPQLWTFEMSGGYTRRFVETGLRVQVGFDGDADARPARWNAAADVAGGAMWLYGFGAELYGVLPSKPATIRLGAVGGVRVEQVPLRGFEPTTCHSKGKSYPCWEQATGAAPFFEPRVAIDLTGSSDATGVALGGFAGVDLVPAWGWTAGVSVTVRLAHWRQRP